MKCWWDKIWNDDGMKYEATIADFRETHDDHIS